MIHYTLNTNIKDYETEEVRLHELKPGDLFFWGKFILVKFSDHIVTHLSTMNTNVMPIMGSHVGHHMSLNSNAKVKIFKDPDDWYLKEV